jgi:hypothetical protein
MVAGGDEIFKSLFDNKKAIRLAFHHAVGDYLLKI